MKTYKQFVSEEKKIEKVFYENLSEASLSKADILKRDNFSIFKDIIDTQKNVKTKEGDTTITWIDNKFKVAYDNNDLDSAFPRNTPVFKTSNGNHIKLNDIEKTEVFGGGKGSGAGSSSTTIGESAQCVYLQTIWNNPKTDFNKTELTQAFSQTKTNSNLESILNLSEDWVLSSTLIAKFLYKVLPKRKYRF